MGGKRVVLIAGPTASGKSALALQLARDRGGTIINADSMQVYDTLRVLTARPSPAEEALAPHRLYGVVDPAERFSTGAWLRAVQGLLKSGELPEGPLLFVGGTGLHLDALTRGFAEVPAIPPEIVAEVEREVRQLDSAGRARLLAERDPLIAVRLPVPDPQRVTRALAVMAHTGQSLASFGNPREAPILAGYSVEKCMLNPHPAVLRQRIAQRFETFMESGAVAEVEALLARRLDASLPAMKAIGVREIAAWLAGRISRESAIDLATIATRQYAKRQRTWFRNRFGDWPVWTGPPK